MSDLTALLDACVLYPAPLRDLLMHPDQFIRHLLDLASHAVCAAAKRQRESLKNPPKTTDEFLAALERQGLAQTVGGLRRYADLI